jgi:hypothetical protein
MLINSVWAEAYPITRLSRRITDFTGFFGFAITDDKRNSQRFRYLSGLETGVM